MFPAVGVGTTLSHLHGEGRKHLIGTRDLEASQAQLHIDFSKILSFALSSGPAPSHTLGTVETTGRKLPLRLLFNFSYAPRLRSVRCSGRPLKSHLYLAACLAVSPQRLGSCMEYWLAGLQLLLTLMHRGIGTDSPRL